MKIHDEVTCYVLAHKRARTLGILAKETELDRSWFDKLLRNGLDMRVSTAQTLLDHKQEHGLPPPRAGTEELAGG